MLASTRSCAHASCPLPRGRSTRRCPVSTPRCAAAWPRTAAVLQPQGSQWVAVRRLCSSATAARCTYLGSSLRTTVSMKCHVSVSSPALRRVEAETRRLLCAVCCRYRVSCKQVFGTDRFMEVQTVSRRRLLHFHVVCACALLLWARVVVAACVRARAYAAAHRSTPWSCSALASRPSYTPTPGHHQRHGGGLGEPHGHAGRCRVRVLGGRGRQA